MQPNNITWLALWKISNTIQERGIGLKMLSFLKNNIQHIGIAVNGINDSVAPLYKALGYKVDESRHYYVTNQYSDIKLLKSPKGYTFPITFPTGLTWKQLGRQQLSKCALKDFLPAKNLMGFTKTPTYFINRYINHPFYDYSIYRIAGNLDLNDGLIVTRIDSYEDSKVLRIVDFLGDPRILALVGTGISELMIKESIEYADFWSYGVKDVYLKKSGFQWIDSKSKVIVPTLFEPFVAANITIKIAYKFNSLPDDLFNIYKADGDQDRPNLIV